MDIFDKDYATLTSIETKELELGQVKITSECKVITNKRSIIENLMNGISENKEVISASLKKVDQEKITSLDDDEL